MKTLTPYIIILGLLVALLYMYRHPVEVVVERVTSDTVTIVKTDTLYRENTIVRSEKVLDTIFVEKSEKTPICITQKHYYGETYEAWVSGYRPSLDSINVFQKIVERTITEVKEKKIYPRTTDFYFNVGNLIINDKFSPNLGASIKFRNNMMAGFKVGYLDDSFYYGIDFGFKLNR